MQVQIYTVFAGVAVIAQAVAATSAPDAEVFNKLCAQLVVHGITTGNSTVEDLLGDLDLMGYTHHWAEVTL